MFPSAPAASATAERCPSIMVSTVPMSIMPSCEITTGTARRPAAASSLRKAERLMGGVGYYRRPRTPARKPPLAARCGSGGSSVMKRSFFVVFLISATGLVLMRPRGLAAPLAPLGPEAQLPANGGAERPDVAVQPRGGCAVAWDDQSARVFSHYVAPGDEAPGEETVFIGD